MPSLTKSILYFVGRYTADAEPENNFNETAVNIKVSEVPSKLLNWASPREVFKAELKRRY